MNIIMCKPSLIFALLCSLLLSSGLTAEESDAEKSQEPFQYFKISPNILTTYQNTGRKMKYVVVQIQVVVRGDKHFELIELHTPLIQDALTDFFNSQDKAVIEDLSQRETLRQQATETVAKVIQEETGEEVVKNILFTQYVYQ